MLSSRLFFFLSFLSFPLSFTHNVFYNSITSFFGFPLRSLLLHFLNYSCSPLYSLYLSFVFNLPCNSLSSFTCLCLSFVFRFFYYLFSSLFSSPLCFILYISCNSLSFTFSFFSSSLFSLSYDRLIFFQCYSLV